MKMPKEIRLKPFDVYDSLKNNKIRYQINADAKTINHEKIYVVEFISNPDYRAQPWQMYNDDKSFRVAISKKQKDYAFLQDGSSRSSRPNMDKFITGHSYVDISDEDKSVLKKLLGEKDVMQGLYDLFKNYHEKQKEIQRKISGYIDDSVCYECPAEYPKGLLDFIRNKVLKKDMTIIYNRGGSVGICAHCGERVRASWPKPFRQYSVTTCPSCGETVQCILKDSVAWKADYVQNVISMERQKNRIWFRQFHILRDNSAKYENLENYIEEIARYVIIGDKTAAWRNEAKMQSWMNHPIYKLEGWERYHGSDVYDGFYEFYCANIAEAVKDTKLQYAELEKYSKLKEHDEVKYCRWFLKYPVFEFLIKTGMSRVLNDKIFHREDKSSYNAISWQQKTLKQCFKIPLRLLDLYEPGEWDIRKLKDCYKLYRAGFKDQDIEDTMLLNLPIDTTINIAKYMTVSKLYEYMERQSSGENVVNYMDYRDYLQDCENLGFDMKSKSILFPKDLRAAHQRTIEMVKYNKSKILNDRILKIYKKHEKKIFEEDGLMIRPAKSANELIKEGKALHHCVGGYAERVANGETAIFFIREKSKKAKPYFTLEFKDNKLIQCRTLNNRSYESEKRVKLFVEHWLKKIRKGA